MMNNIYHIKDPFSFVIFGATGHLAFAKIYPALYSLAEQGRLPTTYHIIGYGRSPMTQEQFQNHIKKSITKAYGKLNNTKVLKELLTHVHYFQGQYDQKTSFLALNTFLDSLFKKKKAIRIAYFAVPPVVFAPIAQLLGQCPRYKGEDIRLVMEKPFGVDAKSATTLFHSIGQHFPEEKVFLLDHYLGKSAVQSILHLRSANRVLQHLLDGREVANIQVTAFEKEGILNRAGYFERMGTLKDMVQSHLLQILALVTMDIPINKSAERLHQEKQSILSSIRFEPSCKNVVLGQYASYKKEKGVAKLSQTETFAALRLFFDRERWFDTPIYIRTGKKTKEKHTYVVIELKKFPFQSAHEEPNRIIIEFYPDEHIHIMLLNKYNSFSASSALQINTASSIECTGDDCLPSHARLLLHLLKGERHFFLSFQEVLASWKVIDTIEKARKNCSLPLKKYKDNSEGPRHHLALPKQDGFSWYDIH